MTNESIVRRIVLAASRRGGLAFGRFVQELAAKRSTDDIDTINLWFTSLTAKQEFIEQLEAETGVEIGTSSHGDILYRGFEGYYHRQSHGSYFTSYFIREDQKEFKILIHTPFVYPDNGTSISFLTWNGHQFSSQHLFWDLDALLSQVTEKKVILLRDFVDLLNRKKDPSHALSFDKKHKYYEDVLKNNKEMYTHAQQIFHDLEECGWDIQTECPGFVLVRSCNDTVVDEQLDRINSRIVIAHEDKSISMVVDIPTPCINGKLDTQIYPAELGSILKSLVTFVIIPGDLYHRFTSNLKNQCSIFEITPFTKISVNCFSEWLQESLSELSYNRMLLPDLPTTPLQSTSFGICTDGKQTKATVVLSRDLVEKTSFCIEVQLV